MLGLMLLASLLLVSGCATLIEGTSQNVAVMTEPSGASCVMQRDGKPDHLYFATASVDGPNAAAMHDALKAVLVGNAGSTGGYEMDGASGHWSHELRRADPEALVVDHKLTRAERLVDRRRNAATRLEGDATWWIDPTNGMTGRDGAGVGWLHVGLSPLTRQGAAAIHTPFAGTGPIMQSAAVNRDTTHALVGWPHPRHGPLRLSQWQKRNPRRA
jgi:hypothetical protein